MSYGNITTAPNKFYLIFSKTFGYLNISKFKSYVTSKGSYISPPRLDGLFGVENELFHC